MAYLLYQAHSGWRYLVILLLVITIVKMLIGWLSNQNWRQIDTSLILATRVAVYIQVILGLILYIMQQRWFDMRFTGEHVVVALLAVGGVELAAARARKAEGDKNKFKFATIGLVIAAILVYVALQAVGGLFGGRFT
jgi:predicted small integral membrane protein